MSDTPFTEDYYERGVELGISGYTRYRWLPEATLALAHELAGAGAGVPGVESRHPVVVQRQTAPPAGEEDRRAWGVNTSFNRQAPMVETPEEAVSLFLELPQVKYLVLDDRMLVK